MKKILYILSAMGLIVSSCSKDIDTDLSSVGDVAASFTNATITRATNGEWDSNEQIGIFAYDEAGAIYNSYGNIPYVTIDGGSPASFTPTNTIIYYPAGGSKLSFIAYSPYQASADDGFYDVKLSAQSTPEEVALIDLIVANDGAQYSNTNTEASLQLDHKLAKLTMTLAVNTVSGLTQSDLVGAQVKLTKIATEGTYDLKGGTFGSYGSSDQTITPRTITADSKFEAIIFPYEIATFDVEFYLPKTDKTYTWEMSGDKFTSGKDHAYTVTIAESKISVSSATLSGWGVNESEELVAIKPWDNTIASGFESGTGSDTAPFIIANGAQLAYLAQQVNDNNNAYDNTYFKLASDIDLNNKEWTPIGKDETNSFNGTFDGEGNTISGLSMIATYLDTDIKWESSCTCYIGLFGCVDGGAISNISVEGEIAPVQFELGQIYVGGIIGYLKSGSVSALSVDVTITTQTGLLAPTSSDNTYIGGAIGKSDISLASSIFNVTTSIIGNTSKSGNMYVGHNVGWCIDQSTTQSANSGYDIGDTSIAITYYQWPKGVTYVNGY